MSTLGRATEVYDSGHCPGCGLPFTQVSVEADYHDPEDGSPVGHEWGAARCSWSSDDLYTTELIATGVVKVGGSPPPAGLDDKLPDDLEAVRARVRTAVDRWTGTDTLVLDKADVLALLAPTLATLADHRDKVVGLTSRTIAQLQEDEANDRMLRAEWDDRDGAA